MQCLIQMEIWAHTFGRISLKGIRSIALSCTLKRWWKNLAEKPKIAFELFLTLFSSASLIEVRCILNPLFGFQVQKSSIWLIFSNKMRVFECKDILCHPFFWVLHLCVSVCDNGELNFWDSDITSTPVLSTEQKAFTSVVTDTASVVLSGIVRAEPASAVWGINLWVCKTEVELVRREAPQNEACLIWKSSSFSWPLFLFFSPSFTYICSYTSFFSVASYGESSQGDILTKM